MSVPNLHPAIMSMMLQSVNGTPFIYDDRFFASHGLLVAYCLSLSYEWVKVTDLKVRLFFSFSHLILVRINFHRWFLRYKYFSFIYSKYWQVIVLLVQRVSILFGSVVQMFGARGWTSWTSWTSHDWFMWQLIHSLFKNRLFESTYTYCHSKTDNVLREALCMW